MESDSFDQQSNIHLDSCTMITSFLAVKVRAAVELDPIYSKGNKQSLRPQLCLYLPLTQLSMASIHSNDRKQDGPPHLRR
jgi:hypothetical protein